MIVSIEDKRWEGGKSTHGDDDADADDFDGDDAGDVDGSDPGDHGGDGDVDVDVDDDGEDDGDGDDQDDVWQSCCGTSALCTIIRSSHMRKILNISQ